MLGRRHEVEGDDSGDDGEHLGDSYVLGAVAVIGVFAITPAISDRPDLRQQDCFWCLAARLLNNLYLCIRQERLA